jgi:hypothetical protein
LTNTEELKSLITSHPDYPKGVPLETFIGAVKNNKEVLDEGKLKWYGERIQSLGVCEEAYKLLYWCMFKRDYPDAHLPLLRGLLKAYETRRGQMIEAWRGFGKSTDLVVWCLLLIGTHPEKSTVFVRINDGKAKESGDFIAETIESSPGWKAAFPHVVPDKEKGWSIERGYNVKRDDVDYAKWRQMCTADHLAEASLLCAGIESGLIIGSHPTIGLWIDDLHDERNTRSMAEMKNVVDILQGNLIPTWFTPQGHPMMGVACTPWDPDYDAYHALMETGMFDKVSIPIFKEDENGEYFKPLDMRVKLAWPEIYPLEEVEKIYNANVYKFFQMYLLDTQLAKGSKIYAFQEFDHKRIDKSWAVTGGVDPVNSMITDKNARGLSHFALAYGAETPYGTAVIIGGELQRISASEGKALVVSAQSKYDNYKGTWCETAGGGQVFIQWISEYPGSKIFPYNLSDVGSGSKGDRQYDFLEGLFRNGLVTVSTESSPFLDCLRSYLRRYPNINNPHAPEWDVADAVVACLYGMPGVRYKPVVGIPLPAFNRKKVHLGAYTYLR